jgi:hypothetical protein
LDKTLKVQNPAPLAQKVGNFAEMEAALAGIDRYNLTRTPNFEPRRSAAVPTYFAGVKAPLVFLPIQGGPVERVKQWLANVDDASTEDLRTRLNQKDLRQWKRAHAGHRSFTVLRHPVARAHRVFCDKILKTGPGSYLQIRQTLRSQYNVPLPEDAPDAAWTKTQHRDAFGGYLVFLKANLSGQTAIRVDATWCSQSQVLQGFGNFILPDFVMREADLETDLAQLSTRLGLENVNVPPIPDETPFSLSEIYDSDIEQLTKAAYQRDYMMFGFAPWSS